MMIAVKLTVTLLFFHLALKGYALASSKNVAPSITTKNDTDVPRKRTVGYGALEPGLLTWNVVVTLLILVNNGTVLLIIIKEGQKTFKGLKLYTVTMLTVSDLVQGVVHIQYIVSRIAGLVVTDEACVLIYVLKMTGLTFSVYGLLVIAIEQYTAVVHPFAYKKFFTEQSAVYVIISIIAISLFVDFIPFYAWQHLDFRRCLMFITYPFWLMMMYATILYIIPSITMIVLYVKVFVVARRHIRAIQDQVQQFGFQTTPTDVNIKSELKLAITIFTVIGLFVCSSLPFWILATVNTYFKSAAIRVDFAGPFVMANSFWNPVIYALRHRDIRQALKRIFCCTGEQQHNYVTSTT